MTTARDRSSPPRLSGAGVFRPLRGETAPPPGRFDPERYGYLVTPTCRCRRPVSRGFTLREKPTSGATIGYGFAVEEPEGVLGRTFAVESIEPYDPKRLKRELKGREAGGAQACFPLAAEELMRRLGLHAGGRPAAGLHENRERFLGYPFKIATFA